jgi:A/G-specific adenine glycosylase
MLYQRKIEAKVNDNDDFSCRNLSGSRIVSFLHKKPFPDNRLEPVYQSFRNLQPLMNTNISSKKYFTNSLVKWHATENDRSLPWKSEKDPYKIWLSEIILQQTRALQALPYYNRFIAAYPTVADMANANDDDAFRLWQGLGYYNRCKNMLATARLITVQSGGQFPESYTGLLQLKGIGPYTAAAIASFAFGLPHAVVDGNVYRVLSRYFRIHTPFDATEGKKTFSTLAGELLDLHDSAAYNQAIMDLGATICKPRNPRCGVCPLQQKCIAYKDEVVELLPIRSKKQTVRKRHFNYLLLKFEDTLWIQKRTGDDIWGNLHEPFLIESGQALELHELMQHELFTKEKFPYSEIRYEGKATQRLTHQIIDSRFFSLQFAIRPKLHNITGEWMSINKLKKTAFPKTLVSFLENNFYV